MKRGTKLFTAAFLSLMAICHQGIAQPEGKQTPEVRATNATAELIKAISIKDSATIKKVYNLQLWAAKSMDSLSALHGMNTAALKKDGKKIDKEYQNQLEDMLNIDQWRNYNRWKARKEK